MRTYEVTGENKPEFTHQQERINWSVHLAGVLFGLVAFPVLIDAALGREPGFISAIIIYSTCFLMVFSFSTLYHSTVEHHLKSIYKKLDRISIYFLIAGTYTPIIRAYLFDSTGISMLWFLWFLVVIGILFEVLFPDRFAVVSVLFYLFMGLVFLFVPTDFFAAMPQHVMRLIVTGVIFYLVGVIFYVWQKWTYHHAIWHLFVLTGSICHYMAIFYTV